MNKLLLCFLVMIFSSSAKALCVVAEVANLRAGPGTNFKVSWVVGKYMPLLKVGSSKGWYKVVDLEGQEHWVFPGLVSQRTKCVAVKRSKVSLRTGPGNKFPKAAYVYADRYTPFKRLTKKNAWYQVIDPSGNKFWVHEDNLWRPVRVTNVSF